MKRTVVSRFLTLAAGALSISLLLPSRAFAFLSPSTVALVAAAAGSFFWASLMALAVNVFLFLQKRTRAIAIGLSVVAVIVVGALVVRRYQVLREMNLPYDDVPLLPYEVDLNSMTMRELGHYQILGMATSAFSLVDGDNVRMLPPNVMREIAGGSAAFEKTWPLDKNRKVLTICENGQMSGKVAEQLRKRGYDAYCARLSRTTNKEFLRKFFVLKKKKPSSTLILVPYNGEANTAFIDFDFILSHQKFAPGSERILLPDFTVEKIEGKNLVCFSNFDCLMTQYFLDERGVKDRKIFKIPIPVQNYQ